MTERKSKLGLFAAIFVVLGNIVGVMIFLEQATVARLLPWSGWFLAAWMLGGVLALIGALSLAELGVMMPEAGGDYVYIREAYGPRLAFLSGWTSVVITFPGSIAAMTVAIMAFQASALFGAWVNTVFLDLGVVQIKYSQVLALGLIALITGINHIGILVAGWAQTAITMVPLVLLLAAGVGAIFVSPSGPVPKPVSTAGASVLSGLFLASVPIFFAYAGWNVITYIGGEIDKPSRNIPASLLIGTAAAIGVYLVVCLVFLKGLGVAHMPGAGFGVGNVALARLFGGWAGQLFLLVIALAVLGSVNATVLAGARISYAMAKDRLVPQPFAGLSPRFKTPAQALWIQAGLAGLLALSGEFDALVRYVVVVMLVFSSLAVGAVIVLRIKRPNAERPYRAWGYPITPAIFVLFSLAVVVHLCVKDWKPVVYGVVITGLGLPVYELMSRRRRPPRYEGKDAP